VTIGFSVRREAPHRHACAPLGGSVYSHTLIVRPIILSEMSADPNAFHDFEHAGWERAAEFYDDAFGALTAQTAGPLLDAAGVSTRTRVLDVASGPGYIADAAAARGATVTGLDFSAAMVNEARRRYPAVSFREGDAEALPFDAGSFDAVVMNFGLLHLARPDAALAEAHRVLRTGGRYAFTVWASPAAAVAFELVLRAVEEFGETLGKNDVPLPEGPPFFRFSDAAETRRTLEDVGFTDIQVQELPLTWRLTSADAVFEALSRGGVRTAAVLRAQTPEALATIRATVRRGVEIYACEGGFAVPMPAVLASATKPQP
jgi:ubiquinone/menaquinone biosynthesis C-methylase UbiE